MVNYSNGGRVCCVQQNPELFVPAEEDCVPVGEENSTEPSTEPSTEEIKMSEDAVTVNKDEVMKDVGESGSELKSMGSESMKKCPSLGEIQDNTNNDESDDTATQEILSEDNCWDNQSDSQENTSKLTQQKDDVETKTNTLEQQHTSKQNKMKKDVDVKVLVPGTPTKEDILKKFRKGRVRIPSRPPSGDRSPDFLEIFKSSKKVCLWFCCHCFTFFLRLCRTKIPLWLGKQNHQWAIQWID